MAKGKFRKNMQARERELQSLRKEFCTPTANGTAAANKYNQAKENNYFDDLIDDLLKKASNEAKRGGDKVLLKDNHILFRFYAATKHANDRVAIYINNQELFEFSDKYNLVIENKTIYFVPVPTGYVLNSKATQYPFITIQKEILVDEIKKSGAENDKEYLLHELPRRRNVRVWYVEV